MRVTTAGVGFVLQRLLKELDTKEFAICPTEESDRIRKTWDHVVYRDDGRPLWLTLTERESLFPTKESAYDLSVALENPCDFRRANCTGFIEAMQAMFDATDDSWNLCSFRKPNDTDMVCVTNKLNLLLNTAFCDCQKHMIHDDESLCLQCSLSLSDEDVESHFCSICQESKAGRMARTRCCGQHFHRRCIREKTNAKCPLCRRTLILI